MYEILLVASVLSRNCVLNSEAFMKCEVYVPLILKVSWRVMD